MVVLDFRNCKTKQEVLKVMEDFCCECKGCNDKFKDFAKEIQVRK